MVKAKPRPSFFKAMMGDFSSSMRIPQSFNKQLRGRLGEKCMLATRGGGRWEVAVSHSSAGEFSLLSGWKQFVNDQSISLGDFLVFFYDGSLKFDVKVYGKSGCDTTNELGSREKKKKRVSANELGNGKKKRVSSKPICIGRTSNESIHLNRPLLEIEKSVAFVKACHFTPPNPHFAIAYRPRCYTSVTIPRALLEEYSLKEKKFITLQDATGRSWQSKLSISPDGRVYMSTCPFWKCNRINEGDACVFEFLHNGDLIHAHIFRSGNKKEVTEPVCTASNSAHSNEQNLIWTDQEEALFVAKSFKTEHPAFVFSWKKSHLYHVNIPLNVLGKLDLEIGQTVVLQDPSGISWPAKIGTWTEGQKRIVGKGWTKFARGNCFVEGDACMLKFVESTKIQVHIFRANETKRVMHVT